MIIPVSAIVPTCNRSKSLENTLLSYQQQNAIFDEIIIIDSSDDNSTEVLCESFASRFNMNINHQWAVKKGAAPQRNQGCQIAKNGYILFMDDDIFFEPFCIERMWSFMTSMPGIGGVSAMITNQNYGRPGKFTLLMCRYFSGKKLKSYAGMCIGPAWNFLPEDNPELPDISLCQWLNTTCTLYKKEALPSPVFPDYFYGYSMMEDLTLSLTVGKEWKLYNVRSSRIFHDSQPGAHKNNIIALEKMELVNRHYVMTKVMNNKSLRDYINLMTLELVNIVSVLLSKGGIKKIPQVLMGKCLGIFFLLAPKK